MDCFFKEFLKAGVIILIAFTISTVINNVFIRLAVKIIIAVLLFIIFNKDYIVHEFFEKKIIKE